MNFKRDFRVVERNGLSLLVNYVVGVVQANSMGHEPNLIHIYSASWGPTDDGKTVDGPRNATMRAIVKGVNEVSTANLLHFQFHLVVIFSKSRFCFFW